MRKSASEILRRLNSRIARLEKQASRFSLMDEYSYEYSMSDQELAIDLSDELNSRFDAGFHIDTVTRLPGKIIAEGTFGIEVPAKTNLGEAVLEKLVTMKVPFIGEHKTMNRNPIVEDWDTWGYNVTWAWPNERTSFGKFVNQLNNELNKNEHGGFDWWLYVGFEPKTQKYKVYMASDVWGSDNITKNRSFWNKFYKFIDKGDFSFKSTGNFDQDLAQLVKSLKKMQAYFKTWDVTVAQAKRL